MGAFFLSIPTGDFYSSTLDRPIPSHAGTSAAQKQGIERIRTDPGVEEEPEDCEGIQLHVARRSFNWDELRVKRNVVMGPT